MTRSAASLKKGTPVTVEGRVKPRSYTVDDIEHKSVSIKANSIRKIDYNSHSAAAPPVVAEIDDSDIPF